MLSVAIERAFLSILKPSRPVARRRFRRCSMLIIFSSFSEPIIVDDPKAEAEQWDEYVSSLVEAAEYGMRQALKPDALAQIKKPSVEAEA